MHPQTTEVIFDYIRGKTHSNVVEIVGATGLPNTTVKINGLVLSGNKPTKNLKELDDEMTILRANASKFDLNSNEFYKTLEFKRFLQLLSSVEYIYSTRLDEHSIWKMDQMTATQKEKFCSFHAEKNQLIREELSQHVLIPKDTIILSAIGKNINIPELTLGKYELYAH